MLLIINVTQFYLGLQKPSNSCAPQMDAISKRYFKVKLQCVQLSFTNSDLVGGCQVQHKYKRAISGISALESLDWASMRSKCPAPHARPSTIAISSSISPYSSYTSAFNFRLKCSAHVRDFSCRSMILLHRIFTISCLAVSAVCK